MNRPNRLDWMIYSFFRWWWNPIFSQNKNLATQFHFLFGMFLKNDTKDRNGKSVRIPNDFWWLE